MHAIRDARENNLSIYFDDLSMAEPLSRQEEEDLADRIQAGDQQARDRLVRANLRFVVRFAANYERWLDLSELIGAGNMGLITAAERFDRTKGCKFISYAVWWVRQAMLQAITEQSRLIRLPANKALILGKMRKRSRELAEDCGAGIDMEEWVEVLAAEMEMSVESVDEVLRADRHSVSLDEAWSGDSLNLLEALPDTQAEAPDTSVQRVSERAALEKVIARLNDREQVVVRSYYGLDNGEAMTLEEIGRDLAITRERVRQIRNEALVKICKNRRQRLLQELQATMGQD